MSSRYFAHFIPEGGVTTSLTADAVIKAERSASFTADAVITVERSASFTADAAIIAAPAASFTADAVIFATVAASFTADAVITTGAVTTSFTADAFIRPYFRADAVIKREQSRSFTANAVKAVTNSRSLLADAYILGYSFQKHDRTDAHEGFDKDIDHTVTWNFDRYFRGDNLQYVLADFDARLTARELGMTSKLYRLLANAVIKTSQSRSLTADAFMVLTQNASFTANAFIQPYLNADAWMRDPNFAINDSVITLPTTTIDAVPRAAVISTSALTWDATNDPDYWFGAGESYKSGWIKINLAAPTTVHIDTINGQGDMVIEVWGGGGPGTWAGESPEEWADENVDDPTNPYGRSEELEVTLAAGTWWILVHPFDQTPSPDFNVVLRVYTV